MAAVAAASTSSAFLNQSRGGRSGEDTALFTRIRLATRSDAPYIHKLIDKMASPADIVTATEESLAAALSASTPFRSFTVFLLEVSDFHFPHHPHPLFSPICETHYLQSPLLDGDRAAFTIGQNDAVVAGLVMFYPDYSMLLAESGLHVKELFVRECYRSRGMERILLEAVARAAVESKLGWVESVVADGDVAMIRAYQEMGAEYFDDRKLHRISGEALRCCARPKPKTRSTVDSKLTSMLSTMLARMNRGSP